MFVAMPVLVVTMFVFFAVRVLIVVAVSVLVFVVMMTVTAVVFTVMVFPVVMSVTAFAFAVSVTFAATMVAVMPVLFVMMTVATMMFHVILFLMMMPLTTMMSMFFKLFQLAFKSVGVFHGGKNLLAVELVPRGCDDCRRRIMSADKFNRVIQFFRTGKIGRAHV